MNNRFVCARVSGPLGAPHLCLASSPHPGGGPVSAEWSLLPLPECPNDPRVGGQGSLADSLLSSGCGVALRDDLLGGAVTRIQERTGAGEDRSSAGPPLPQFLSVHDEDAAGAVMYY